MAFTLTPNMNLPVPGVGTEAGPDYASDVNNCLTILDGHDHSPGYGAPIGPAGLNINTDLSFQINSATNVRTLRFSPLSAAPANPADLGCMYEVGADLYFTDGVGNSVRLTQGGAVAGTPGSIANLVSPASASYNSSSKTFIFQSAALTPANLDGASVILRNLSASSFGMTVSPPSLTVDMAITLPLAPASTLPVLMSSAGVQTCGPITLAQLTQSIIDSLVPAGSILAYGGTAAPAGYLMCDGSAVSRVTYSALFAAIGSANGSGDGTTTFNLPDARGMFLRGVSGASGNDPDSASRTAANTGGNTGNNVGSVQADQFGSHAHTYPGQGAASAGGSFSAVLNTPNTPSVSAAAGGNETRPKNIYTTFIIKT